MNFLAHSWLARHDEAHIAGAFLGDFVKGPIPSSYPSDLQSGIRLHRHIDSETNRMEEMRATYWRFGKELRRVAPILLDLVADHLLAVHWSRHGNGKLSEFTNYCYRAVGKFEIPCSAVGFYQHTVERDLWSAYADLDVILDIMRRILVRLDKNQYAESLSVIHQDLDLFYEDFQEYFPLLEKKVDWWWSENVDPGRENFLGS